MWNDHANELKELTEIAKLIEKEHDQSLYNELRKRIKKFDQDFSKEEFLDILNRYKNRDRRFGKVG